MKHAASLSIPLAFLSGLAPPATAREPERPGQESFVSRAVFADGRLWLLSDAGALYSLAEADEAAVREALPEPMLDLCVRQSGLLALTGRDGAAQWTLRRRDGAAWRVVRRVATRGDRLVALTCDADAPTLLTSRRVITLASRGPAPVALSGPIRGGRGTIVVHATADHLFVGINAGEWGGGLRRIDRRTGRVATIERNISGDLCDGPLNTGCDPVNAIVDDPWRPDCVVAAIGLVHMMAHGRLTRICGDRVERLYFSPLGVEGEDNSRVGKDGEPFSTVAFFGLISSGDVLLAMGIDGIHRVGRDGRATVTPLPRFRHVGRFEVSFGLPGVVLVLTNVNQRLSLSGAVPLLVPR